MVKRQVSHEIKAGWGPGLAGVFQRPIGSEPGYRYGSYLSAREAEGAIWTEAALRAWIVGSKSIAKSAGGRTKMPAQDLSEAELDAVVRYLRSLQ